MGQQVGSTSPGPEIVETHVSTVALIGDRKSINSTSASRGCPALEGEMRPSTSRRKLSIGSTKTVPLSASNRLDCGWNTAESLLISQW